MENSFAEQLIGTQSQIEAGKHALDEWAKIYLAPTSVPFELKPTGSVFRGMSNEDAAKEYAEQVVAFFRVHGLEKTAFVVRGPTSTTRCTFEVCTETAGYTVVYRTKAAEKQQSGEDAGVVTNQLVGADHVQIVDGPVVITTQESGVYLGNALGLGFWSKEDPVGQPSAVTFKSVQEAEAHMATWDCGRPDHVKFVQVTCDDDGYASIEACVAAGLPRWSADVSHEQNRS